MGSRLTLDDGYGFADVDVRGPDGTLNTVRLDLWEANNQFAHITAATPDAVAQGQAWCDWLAGKGLPGLSHGAGYKVLDLVSESITDLKKKDPSPPSSGSPDSPSSSAPPSSD